MKIIVTIPAYNEEKSIGILIKKIKNIMSKVKHNYQILVVDDGSKDRTSKSIEELHNKDNKVRLISFVRGKRVLSSTVFGKTLTLTLFLFI